MFSLIVAASALGSAQSDQHRAGVFIPNHPTDKTERLRQTSHFAKLIGRLVTIDQASGGKTLVRVVSMSDSELIATVDGVQRVFPVHEVDRISLRGDSLKNGALIGAAVGSLWGVLSLQGLPCTIPDCRLRATGRVLTGVGFGVGVGMWVDKARVGRTMVYSRRGGIREGWRQFAPE